MSTGSDAVMPNVNHFLIASLEEQNWIGLLTVLVCGARAAMSIRQDFGSKQDMIRVS